KRFLLAAVALAIAPLTANAQTFDSIFEYGNAADSNAVSGAGVPRGFTAAAGTYTITAGGTDFWSPTDHGSAIFDSAAAPVTDNFSAVVKVQIGLAGESMPGEWGRSGIMARTTPDDPTSAYFASTQKFDGPNQHILQARDVAGGDTSRPSDGATTTLITGPRAAADGVDPVPVWLALHRYNGGIYSTWAPDEGGSPGAWSNAEARNGSADHLGPVHLGLFHQNHNVQPETSTATFTDFAATGFNPDLGNFPLANSISVSDLPGKVQGSWSAAEIGGGAAEAATWKIEKLGADSFAPGLTATTFLRGNGGTMFNPAELEAHAVGTIPNIAWAGNANPPPEGMEKYPDVFNLPADTDSDGDNQENYSVDARGQIFIPEAGTYQFKDGIDDYTYLEIDGEVLIDDNNWTGISGVDNGGSPIVSKEFAEAGWKDFTFQMAEGGGGDAGVLYWDYNNDGFPAGQTDPAGLQAIIPAENFRSVQTEVLETLEGVSIVDGVAMDAGGNMMSVMAGDRIRLTVNGESQVINIVPEPSSLALCLVGVLGLLKLRRRSR
ncbi:MAG: PEP-CTERM sorting domain-containing protein, partial [Planctomycetales bacterium]|nr:PEP-CTERM sorting domain-containing protein [Planctomycetales bacterium]